MDKVYCKQCEMYWTSKYKPGNNCHIGLGQVKHKHFCALYKKKEVMK